MKKALSILTAILLLLSLTACGAKSEAAMDMAFTESAPMAPAESPAMDTAAGAEMGWYAEPEMEEVATEEAIETEATTTQGTAAGSAASQETIAEKIIYSASLGMETTEFAKTLSAIEGMISQYGGYIQFSNVYGDTRYNDDGTTTVVNRYAMYSIAVPTEHFETVLTESGNIGNVTSTIRNAENITSAYMDTEARLDSLHVQEERLMAMMEETGDLESLIALEARLADVTYEIESYQRQINNWDRRIAYSTIDLEVQEVSIYTPTAPVTRTFGEKLSDAFSDGWRSFTRGCQRFVLWFAESLPALILWAAILTGAFFLLRKWKKVRQARKAKKAVAKQAPDKTDDGFPR